MTPAGTAMARVIANLPKPKDASEPPKQPPYPWCSQPEKCSAKGYCLRDPNCGD